MKTLVLIPAYNEQDSIVRVVRHLQEVEPSVDYLVLDDGSTDLTSERIAAYGINHVSHPINMGIGVSMQTGYLYAKNNAYDIAIQLDGDGQHNPEYIKDIMLPIIEGEADLVIGSRFIQKEGFQSSACRRLGISILHNTIRLFAGARVQDVTSGFRACSKEVISYFADHYAEDYPEAEAVMAASLQGFRLMEVPVVMNERTRGRSSIYGLKSLNYMVKVVLAIIIHSIRFRLQRGRKREQ